MELILTKKEKLERQESYRRLQEENRKKSLEHHRPHTAEPHLSAGTLGIAVICVLFFLFAILPAILSEPLTLEEALRSYDPNDGPGFINSAGFRE